MDEGRGPQPQPSDEALAARVAARDAAALAALYDRYARPVYSMAAYSLGTADAEEVVQDVFLSLWNKAGQFDPARSSFGAWFMAIARHRVLDELRRRGYQQRLLAGETADRLLATTVDESADVAEEAWQRQRGEAVAQALRDLPDEQRRVLMLAYFAGLSHSAMAHHLGWPLGTVKKRIRLGLQKLRRALAPPAGVLSDSPAMTHSSATRIVPGPAAPTAAAASPQHAVEPSPVSRPTAAGTG
ncbi:MAG: sigma-70 family RNA polymerase sigma factor [Chloroflexi bacterium]|nr:sigma-70 family RNA polymerase sigma factor [Chloroflexota bacterium]